MPSAVVGVAGASSCLTWLALTPAAVRGMVQNPRIPFQSCEVFAAVMMRNKGGTLMGEEHLEFIDVHEGPPNHQRVCPTEHRSSLCST